MKSVFCVLLLIINFACQTNDSNTSNHEGWRMVYQHDKQGNLVNGSKAKVVEAVRNGLSIRVAYGDQGAQRSIEHITDAQFLTILKSSDTTEVFAQVSPIMRQGRFSLGDTVGIKLVPGYKWLTAIGTNGMCSNVMVNTFQDTLDGSNQNRRGAMWFVEYPQHFESRIPSLTTM